MFFILVPFGVYSQDLAQNSLPVGGINNLRAEGTRDFPVSLQDTLWMVANIDSNFECSFLGVNSQALFLSRFAAKIIAHFSLEVNALVDILFFDLFCFIPTRFLAVSL